MAAVVTCDCNVVTFAVGHSQDLSHCICSNNFSFFCLERQWQTWLTINCSEGSSLAIRCRLVLELVTLTLGHVLSLKKPFIIGHLVRSGAGGGGRGCLISYRFGIWRQGCIATTSPNNNSCGWSCVD